MTIRILVNELSPRGKAPSVTINTKLRRLTFNKSGLELLREHFVAETEYLQILLDDENPDLCWLRLCESDAAGARKMDRPSASTRSVNISLLMREINLNLEKTRRFPIFWDSEVDAAKVDLRLQEAGIAKNQ